jgi:hypothetical protein
MLLFSAMDSAEVSLSAWLALGVAVMWLIIGISAGVLAATRPRSRTPPSADGMHPCGHGILAAPPSEQMAGRNAAMPGTCRYWRAGRWSSLGTGLGIRPGAGRIMPVTAGGITFTGVYAATTTPLRGPR